MRNRFQAIWALILTLAVLAAPCLSQPHILGLGSGHAHAASHSGDAHHGDDSGHTHHAPDQEEKQRICCDLCLTVLSSRTVFDAPAILANSDHPRQPEWTIVPAYLLPNLAAAAQIQYRPGAPPVQAQARPDSVYAATHRYRL